VRNSEISGKVDKTEDGYRIQIELEDVDLGELDLVKTDTDLGLKSRIDGEISLFVNPKRILATSGNVSITPKSLQTKSFVVPIFGQETITIPSKKDDGSYPLTVTGRIQKPKFKVGTIPLSF